MQIFTSLLDRVEVDEVDGRSRVGARHEDGALALGHAKTSTTPQLRLLLHLHY